jgi:hypothetical protein
MSLCKYKYLAGVSLLLVSTVASAEDYVAKVLTVPAPYGQDVMINGAGDNGLMSGHVDGGIFGYAVYFTTQGGMRIMEPSNNSYLGTYITDSWGATYHSGYGSASVGTHALFWVGGNPQPVDLHPSGLAQSSWAEGIDGQYQCGRYLAPNNSQGACLWSRTASSFRALKSGPYSFVVADGVDSTDMPAGLIWFVGHGALNDIADSRALFWPGITADPIDLSVAGYGMSEAHSCDYPQVAGYAIKSVDGSDYRHAALWNQVTHTFVDLNPNATFKGSEVLSVRNGVQVGWAGVTGNTSSGRQATLWHGVAATWTNLKARLPFPYNTRECVATDIDAQGNVVGWATNNSGAKVPCVWFRQ